jgi:hypothetical protein
MSGLASRKAAQGLFLRAAPAAPAKRSRYSGPIEVSTKHGNSVCSVIIEFTNLYMLCDK